MKWLGWSGWESVSNPFPVPEGVWLLEVRSERSDGGVSQIFIFVWKEIWQRLWLPLLALVVFVLGCFGVAAYRKRKNL